MTTNQPISTSLTRSSRYYHDTVTFLVEETIYKVLRKPFTEKSPVFRNMFLVPQADPQSTEGLLDSTPISLEGVLARDFEAILDLISSEKQSETSIPNLSLEHWISVLKLSRVWLMEDVHTTAYEKILEKLSQESFPRRIQVAREFCFADVFRDGCLELVNRPEPAISFEEAECLGMRKAFGLIRARDVRQRTELASYTTHRGPYIRTFHFPAPEESDDPEEIKVNFQDPEAVVDNLFQEELKFMREEYSLLFDKDDSGFTADT